MREEDKPRMARILDLDELMPIVQKMMDDAVIEKGKLDDLRRRVGMLVTNFVQRVWHGTTGEYLKEEKSVEYVWFTVGDERTCDICQSNHGRRFASMEEVMGDYPPHPFCRCWIEVETAIPAGELQWNPPTNW